MKWFIGVLLLLLAAVILESGLLAYAMCALLALLVVSRFLAHFVDPWRQISTGLFSSTKIKLKVLRIDPVFVSTVLFTRVWCAPGAGPVT
jgi:hypothetical protein